MKYSGCVDAEQGKKKLKESSNEVQARVEAELSQRRATLNEPE